MKNKSEGSLPTPLGEGSPRGDFRKKPVVIHAVKWTGDNLREIIEFTGLHPSAEKWTWEEYEAVVAKDGLKIFTLEGPLMAAVGDWIICGVKGEFYPCKPDIFAATYEPVAAIAPKPEEPMERRMLRDLISHWREFGPQYGFDEKIESFDKALNPPFVSLVPRSETKACPNWQARCEWLLRHLEESTLFRMVPKAADEDGVFTLERIAEVIDEDLNGPVGPTATEEP